MMANKFVIAGLGACMISIAAGATAFAATDNVATTPKPKAEQGNPEPRPCPRYLPQAAALKDGTPALHRLGDEPSGVMMAAVDRREGGCRRPLILQSLVPPPSGEGRLIAL